MICLGLLIIGLFQIARAEVIINPQALRDDLEKATIEAYKTQWPSENTQWSVECLNLPSIPIHLKGDNFSKDIRFSNTSFNSPNNIAMLTLVSNQASYRLGVAVRVKVKKLAWEVLEVLNAKQRIEPRHLQLTWHEFDDLGRYVLPEKIAFERLRSRVNLQPHSILESRNTEEIPFVFQNATITLILSMPNDVQVKTQAVALENGFLGDHVRVARSTQNQHRILYTATVIRENTVKVAL